VILRELQLRRGLLFWAKGDLAEANGTRPSESLVEYYCNALAQAREPRLSETGLIA